MKCYGWVQGGKRNKQIDKDPGIIKGCLTSVGHRQVGLGSLDWTVKYNFVIISAVTVSLASVVRNS